MIRQLYSVPCPINIASRIDQEWQQINREPFLKPGMRVAVGVGSRGVSNLVTVVSEVVARLKACGCDPFIVPAMGSHGGATADGQIGVLTARGIVEANVGAPVYATMDVVSMGEVEDIPLFVDKLAYEADGIVLINRIKPHTNFIGATESGLIKMMAIGLGNQKGAEHYHRLTMVKDFYKVIGTAGAELINRCRVLFGVGLVENQNHETCDLKIIPAKDISAVEARMLTLARKCLPTIPLGEIDLLIVDEMGKDISGEGIDPNVVGRDVCTCGVKRPLPRITRIFIRDLTKGSEGSALGVGQADFTVKRLVDKIDFEATIVNCLTSCCPESGMVPLTFPTDREAISAALKTIRPYTLEDLRLVHIKNTMDLTRLQISHGCLDELENRPDVEIDPLDRVITFDSSNALISPFDE